MATYLHTGEGTDGTTITTTNAPSGSNNWASVTIGASALFQYDDAQVTHGSASILGQSATVGSDRCYARWNVTASGQVMCRAYVRFSGLPSANNMFMALATSGGTRVCATYLSTGGYFIIQDSSTTQTNLSSATVALDTWHRFEMAVDRTSNTLSVRRYLGDSSTLADSATFSSPNLTPGDIGMAIYGKWSTSGTFPSFWLDSMKTVTDTTTWIGPEVIQTPITYGRHIVIGQS